MKDIYKILEKLGIKYEKHEHPAVFTIEDSEKYKIGLNVNCSKSLFLRNKKGDKHYLVVLEASKRIKIKELELSLNEKDLSFASPDRLMKYLHLTPGSVSPFGLINDVDKAVCVIVDNDLMKLKKQGYHPNINTATLVISTDDFKKFLDWTGNKIAYLDL